MQPAEDSAGGSLRGSSPGGSLLACRPHSTRPTAGATAHGRSRRAADVDERALMPPVSLPSEEAHPGLRLRRKAARDGAPPHPPVGGPPLCGA
jgi:hypothetical protein